MDQSKSPLLYDDVAITGNGEEGRYTVQETGDKSILRCCRKHSSKACCFHRLTKVQCGLTFCFGLLLLVVTFILVVILLGPKMARNELNNTKVIFTKLDIIPRNSHSFLASSDLEVSNVAPIDGVMAAMSVNVSHNGSVFGVLDMPEMSIKAYKLNKKHLAAQPMEIINMDAWHGFSYAMMHGKTVEWELASTASVSSSFLGIHLHFTDIPFQKKVPLNSFNGLDDVQLSIFDLTQSQPDMIIIRMTVCMRNPSEIEIESLGSLFFAVEYKGAHMGNVTASNTTIRKTFKDPSDDVCVQFGNYGYNSILMSGRLLPSNRDLASEMMSRYLSNIDTNVTAISLNPATTIELFNYAMEGLELNTVLNGDAIALITGLTFNDALITPITTLRLTMRMSVNVTMSNPLGPNSPLDINWINMTVQLRYKNSTIGTAVTGVTKIPKPNTVNGNSTITIDSFAGMNLWDQGVELATFAKDLIKVETIELDLQGFSATEAYSHALGWAVDVEAVSVDLSVSFPGMNGLKGVKILDYSLSGNIPNDTDGCKTLCGIYMTLTAEVVNPSPFGLVIGEMNSEVRNIDGVVLGSVGTSKLTLHGNIVNVMAMSGKLAPRNLTAAANFMSNYMSKKTQPTIMVGLNAGSSSVEWLQTIAKGLELEADFPGADDGFQALTNCTLSTLSMVISEDNKVVLTGTIMAKMNLPKQVNPAVILDVYSSTMEFWMVDIQSSIRIGKVTVNSAPVDYTRSTQMIKLTFAPTELVILNEGLFEELMADLLSLPSKTIKMTGFASPHVSTNMGVLQLKDIPFSEETVMYGFNAFIDEHTGKPLMLIESIDISDGKVGVLDLLVNATITNPSNVAPTMGKVVLQLWTNSSYYLGDVTVPNFKLNANEERNAVTRFENLAATFVTPSNNLKAEAAARLFLSSYISGVDQIGVIRGTSESSSIDILKHALANFTTSSYVPGSSAQLISEGIMTMPQLISPKSLPTVLKVYNPFASNLTITAAHNDLVPCHDFSTDGNTCKKYYTDSVGYYTPDQFTAHIEARQSRTLVKQNVQLYSIFSNELIHALTGSATGGSFVNVHGTMNITVGEFGTQVDFKETNVRICLKYYKHTCESFLADA